MDMTVCRRRAGDEEAWATCLRQAPGGTLFHDLAFLAYHPEGRFHVHDLLIRDAARVVGVLPAAIVEEDAGLALHSPRGASVGGPALVRGLDLGDHLRALGALEDHARGEGLAAIQLDVPPEVYSGDGELGFALFAAGYRLERRLLLQLVALGELESEEQLMARFSGGKRRDVVSGRRAGLRSHEVGSAGLDSFWRLLEATYAEHQSLPTHSRSELQDLLERLPRRVRLFLCELEGEPLAGVLLFVLNERVAYTFYICDSRARRELYATSVLVAHVLETLRAEGLTAVDLGPSSFPDLRLNPGVAFFKRGFGAFTACRDRWRKEFS